jgi:hypothetical protein
LGDLYFHPGVFIEFNVNTVIQKPVYPIDVEAEQDQEKDVHKLFQRYEKQYAIMFKGIESMADTCSLLPLMDEVYVNGVRCFDVNVDITWDEEYECLATIIITYITKKIIKTL